MSLWSPYQLLVILPPPAPLAPRAAAHAYQQNAAAARLLHRVGRNIPSAGRTDWREREEYSISRPN
eukprot:1081851-Prorocentrum_minimum.AAC.1